VNTSHSHLRRIARTATVSIGAAVVVSPLIAMPAYAQVPQGWSDPKPVNGLHALLVLGGIPLGLFVLITLLVLAPSLARGERLGTSSPSNEWFGGPRTGTDELEAADSGREIETGGASGRW
jgi:hypothetical protein